MNGRSLFEKKHALINEKAVEDVINKKVYDKVPNTEREQELTNKIIELEAKIAKLEGEEKNIRKEIYPAVSRNAVLEKELNELVDLFMNKYIIEKASSRVEVYIINALMLNLADEEDIELRERQIRGLLEKRNFRQQPSNSINYYAGIALKETPETIEFRRLANIQPNEMTNNTTPQFSPAPLAPLTPSQMSQSMYLPQLPRTK